MDTQHQTSCTAFLGNTCLASGELHKVARRVKEKIGDDDGSPVLIFNDATSRIVEIDFRGAMEDVLARLGKPTSPAPADTSPKRGPGRPKLGVVPREVTLLPRHWDWLNSQPGGASVALRKLVDEARRVNSSRDEERRSQEVTYRFISAMAGDLPGFEEASRALFANDAERFNHLLEAWPADIKNHTRKLADTLLNQANTLE